MNEVQREKIKRFMNDVIMSDSVYNILLDSFLKRPPNADVHVLAASSIAVDCLKQGWNYLGTFKQDRENTDRPSGNPAL